MRILLTGKTGQVGFELRRALAPFGEVIAVGRTECDLTDPDAIRAILHRVNPDVIVNPAAYTAVDKAESEPDQAFAVNAVAPGVLADWAASKGRMMIHYSTDYVFDGTKKGFYTEHDQPNPQNVYGRSKWMGEQAVQVSGAKSLILRTSWVMGKHGSNFARTILRLAAERDTLSVVDDQVGAPTSAALIADVTTFLLREVCYSPTGEAGFPYGLYHLAAGGEISWYGYARYIVSWAQAAGIRPMLIPESIRPISTHEYPTPARRPLNSRLATGKLRAAFGVHVPEWQMGLDCVLEQMLERI